MHRTIHCYIYNKLLRPSREGCVLLMAHMPPPGRLGLVELDHEDTDEHYI